MTESSSKNNFNTTRIAMRVVDIGNTNTKIGEWDGREIVKTYHSKTSEAKAFGERGTPVYIASVVPEALKSWENVFTDAKCVKTNILPRIGLRVKEPSKVGIDRVMGAYAVWCRVLASAIIVDIGTAITIDAINDKGEFLGGAISPGVDACFSALHNKASQLPKLSATFSNAPLIGKDTNEAIQSGVKNGIECMVEGLVKKMCLEVGTENVFVTGGGFSEKRASAIGEWVPNLVLEGIAKTAEGLK